MYNLIVTYSGASTPYDIYTGTTTTFADATLVLTNVTTYPVILGEFDVTQVYVFFKTQDCEVQMLSYGHNVPTPTPTITPSISLTPTLTRTPTKSITPTRTPTKTPLPSGSPTATPTPSITPSESPTTTPTVSVTKSMTPSVTASKTPGATPTPTPTISNTPYETPTPSVTPSVSVTTSLTPSVSEVCYKFQINVLEVFGVTTIRYFDCDSRTYQTVDVHYGTPLELECVTEGSITGVGSDYSVDKLGTCHSVTPTPTSSITPTPSISKSGNVTPTPTNSVSLTASHTPTNSVTPSVTPSITASVTPTITPNSTQSPTPTQSNTPTLTTTPSITPTHTPTPSPSTPASVNCNCPSGYTPTIDGSRCVQYSTTGATSPTTGDTLVAKSLLSYGNFGTVLFSTYNSNGTYIDTPTFLTTSFWSNPNTTTTDGPLNRCAVWGSRTANAQEIGFSSCFNVAQQQTFYIGMAADNYCIVKLDGQVVVSQDVNALMTQFGTDAQVTFKYWFIYPVTMQAGKHVLEVIGHNESSAAAVGVEIYNNTAAEITGATSYSTLNLFFTSASQVGQPVTLGNLGVGYTCPAGWSLVMCDESPYCQLVSYQNCGT